MRKKEHQNSGTLGKDTINKWIISFLSVGKRGFKSNFDLASIFLLILKRLKTGVQWRELPIESYFEKGEISWQNVYYYFNKWSKVCFFFYFYTPSLSISVKAPYRQKGIGTALMQAMLTLLKTEGYKQVSLSVQKANYARKLYLKLGFEIVKTNEEDEIMVCNL